MKLDPQKANLAKVVLTILAVFHLTFPMLLWVFGGMLGLVVLEMAWFNGPGPGQQKRKA